MAFLLSTCPPNRGKPNYELREIEFERRKIEYEQRMKQLEREDEQLREEDRARAADEAAQERERAARRAQRQAECNLVQLRHHLDPSEANAQRVRDVISLLEEYGGFA